MRYALRTVNTGIEFVSIIPGLVPEIEEREAARFNGYTWKDWLALPKSARIDGTAHFRLIRVIDMNKDDAISRDQQRHNMQRGIG